MIKTKYWGIGVVIRDLLMGQILNNNQDETKLKRLHSEKEKEIEKRK